MKVALVHDYLKEYGGAERVLEVLHEIWPEAPVFTTVYLPEFLGPHRKRFENWDIRTSILQRIPFKTKLISVFRIIAPLIFRSWDFSNYDVVVVSATGAYTPNVISNFKFQISNTQIKGQKFRRPIFITYCHTPPRYLYGYPTAREWKKNLMGRILGELVNHFLRLVDFKSSQNVDFFIANSKNVAGRIKKFYRREAVVIYPPVDIPSKTSNLKPKTYFLAGGRLARPKRIDLAVAACTKLNLPLKIFGKQFAGYGEELKTQISKLKTTSQKSKVEFLGEVTEGEKWRLMRDARAFIFPAEEEDFGITPVEAMAVGSPVIALRSGGVIESIAEGETGVFFDQPSVEALVSVLLQFDKVKFDRSEIIKQAQKFSKERFKREIKVLVDTCFLSN